MQMFENHAGMLITPYTSNGNSFSRPNHNNNNNNKKPKKKKGKCVLRAQDRLTLMTANG
jgi:hypothetical protein